ncbi:hypothetical protein BMS3Abin07_00508 [bacterium BMS3Abin07]|nr:hypothetical protein BMS3Abin07_00508 [bacterium BMS3Abin07]GBE31112.1 hypothetical protein BMS3Bbin05_00008 [bacterium BMS3Bbin05]HDL20990.1 hypothetical protein [Nitrospirota bacterium]HDO22887.1 hypothetical protein [Nitrospirota bacterium]HDZ87211.1 hypothetical protein [Nitrospirota bacterium]
MIKILCVYFKDRVKKFVCPKNKNMNIKKLENKLAIALTQNLGVNINSGFKDDILGFREKLTLLSNTDHYNKLIKSLTSSKNKIEFNSYVFETYFAYDFESKGRTLEYETKLLGNSDDTVDFLYRTYNGMRICFDLHQANQRKWLTDYTRSQLANRGRYEITLSGQDEKDKIVRLQNLILSKCQNKNGNPRKFPQDSDIYNFIVIYVSGEIDGHIDELECKFTMYGDSNLFGVRWIFGLCEHLSDDSPENFKLYYEKLKHFRETIHGVLFVKNASPPNCYGDLILDLDLEYYLVGNNDLLNKADFNKICDELYGILKEWTKKDT